MKKSIFSIALLITGALCVVFFVGLGKNDDKGMLKIISGNADLQVKDFHYTEVGDSEGVWEIKADRAQYFKNKSSASFVNVRVKLIASDGGIYVMTGDEGKLNTDSKDIEVHGNVVVISGNKDRLESDDIKYAHKDKRIYTDSVVTMDKQTISVKGRGLSISIRDKSLSVFSHVKATIVNWKG
ncbi:MAG: LPS export ABC transporter periplasmic protein LptC [Deltaproteobacteria bacterium]|nr:LPS export ABC transporter periplasmic protein LptC [Deltaproteobacteria bacterium]